MTTVVLVIHLMLAIALVVIVLIQRSEGGGLGIGGGGGGMSGLMTGRATHNLLTRTTAVLAALFMLTSLGLSWLAEVERAPVSVTEEPVAAPVPVQPPEPAEPAEPAVPVAE